MPWLSDIVGDFADYLPRFSERLQADGLRPGTYDFGISDIRHVDGLEDVLRASLEDIISEIGVASFSLPGIQGYAPLSARLAELVEQEAGLATSVEDVILTDGGCDGIALAAQTLCGSGTDASGIIYAVPAFPYWWVLDRAGVQQFPLLFESGAEYRDSFADRVIAACEAEPRIRVILLNEPHNPFGIPLPQRALQTLAAYVERRGLTVILDDVGRGLIESGPSRWCGDGFSPDRVIVIDSFTKRFAVPGFRLGFVRASGTAGDGIRARIANCRVGVSNVIARLGERLMERFQGLEGGAAVRREVTKRLTMLCHSLTTVLPPSITYEQPSWGMSCVLNTSRWCELHQTSGRALARALRDGGVIVMDDRFLVPQGLESPMAGSLIRVSIGAEPRVEEGIDRLGVLLEELDSARRPSAAERS